MTPNYFTLLFGIFYVAAAVSGEYVNFVNEDRTFSCSGSNVNWFLPSGQKVSNRNPKYQVTNGTDSQSLLLIQKVGPSDIGPYKCASDGKEEILELKLFYPLTIEYLSESQTVKENDDVTFRCKARGVPNAEVKWYFGDHTLLVQDENVKIFEGGIILKKVQPDQAGTYTCISIQKLRNFKHVLQRSLSLVVEHEPESTSKSSEIVYGSIGQTLTLRCYFKAVPHPQYQWLKNGYQIFDNVKILDDISRLEVHLSSQESFENYTCSATNNHGQQKKVFLLQEQQVVSGSQGIKASAFLIASLVVFKNIY